MKPLTFSENEVRKIKKTLTLLIADMHELLKIAPLTHIIVPFDMEPDKEWGLKITEKEIKIYEPLGSIESDNLTIVSYRLERTINQRFGKTKRIPIELTDNDVINCVYKFISKYEGIRKDIEEEIKIAQQEKQINNEELEKLSQKYDKEATIEIDLPESMNQHTLEVRQENGKTIGEVKMGYGTIRIITRGNILLANNQEKETPKQKRIGE